MVSGWSFVVNMSSKMVLAIFPVISPELMSFTSLPIRTGSMANSWMEMFSLFTIPKISSFTQLDVFFASPEMVSASSKYSAISRSLVNTSASYSGSPSSVLYRLFFALGVLEVFYEFLR